MSILASSFSPCFVSLPNRELKAVPCSWAGLKQLRGEHAGTIAPAREQAAEALQLERQLGDLVNEAYGLTPEEVALMWKTAPPRMPYMPNVSR